MSNNVGTAVFSGDQIYRYVLTRQWDKKNNRSIMFVGLNPSTATATEDDATIRRCVGFAIQWGYGKLYMLNIFAYRSKSPKVMRGQGDPVGGSNNHWLLKIAARVDLIVAAWGNGGVYRGRHDEVMELFQHRNIFCLGMTQAGIPRHPLYLKKGTKVMNYYRGV